jgi:benzoylformate decarboxylase
MDLTSPELSFVEIARGMGVAGLRITRAADVAPALTEALASNRPHLLQVVVEGRR